MSEAWVRQTELYSIIVILIHNSYTTVIIIKYWNMFSLFQRSINKKGGKILMTLSDGLTRKLWDVLPVDKLLTLYQAAISWTFLHLYMKRKALLYNKVPEYNIESIYGLFAMTKTSKLKWNWKLFCSFTCTVQECNIK